MCCVETLELIFIIVLTFIVFCLLWRYKNTIVNMLCGSHICFSGGETDQDQDERYEVADVLSRELINELLDVLNNTYSMDQSDRLMLTDVDEDELVNQLLVPKKTFAPQSEEKNKFKLSNLFGKTSKVAIGSGNISGAGLFMEHIYTNEYVQSKYGPDVHLATYQRPRLGEFLDWEIPIRIFLPKQMDDKLLTMLTRKSNEWIEAVEAREEAFKFIMENTHIMIDGEEMEFLKFLLTWKWYSNVNSNSVYYWAHEAFNKIAEVSQTQNPEWVYTAYTIVVKYYSLFIHKLENNIIQGLNPEVLPKEKYDNFMKYNDHMKAIITNMRHGYFTIFKKFGNEMEHYSTVYIYSVLRKFEDASKHTFPKLVKEQDLRSSSKKLMDTLRKKAKMLGKLKVITSDLAAIAHHATKDEKKAFEIESRLKAMNPLREDSCDKIIEDDILEPTEVSLVLEEAPQVIVETISFKDRKKKQAKERAMRLKHSNKVYIAQVESTPSPIPQEQEEQLQDDLITEPVLRERKETLDTMFDMEYFKYKYEIESRNKHRGSFFGHDDIKTKQDFYKEYLASNESFRNRYNASI